MNDREIDALIRAAAVSDEQVTSPALDGLVTEMRERTMSPAPSATSIATEPFRLGEGIESDPYAALRERARPPRRRLAAAALAIVIGGGAVVAASGPDRTTPTTVGPAAADPAPSTAAVPAAEGPPRLLVRAEGWQVTEVNESAPDDGEVRYGLDGAVFGEPSSIRGENTLELTWRPPQTGEDRADDPESFAPLDDVVVAGRPTRLYAALGSDTFQAQWVEAGLLLELRGDAATEADFRTVVATIEAVDLETWLAALPEDVVRPDEWATAVAEARTGIPTPSGFDEAVWDRALIIDRTALASHVAGTLACAWIDRYAAASTARDAAALDEATAALVGIDDWPVLSVTSAPFATNVRRVADEVVATGVVIPPNPEAGGPSACLSR